MLRKGAFSVVLLLLVSSVAMSQTQQQQETKDSADALENINVPAARTDAQSADGSALARWVDAMGMRLECMGLGATAEELAPGDSFVDLGDVDVDDADDWWDVGDSDHTIGDVEYAEGNANWIAGFYAAACTIFIYDSIPAHESAEWNYGHAEDDWEAAYDHYSDAYYEFLELWFNLQ